MLRPNSICANDPLDHGKENGGILQCACAQCPFVTVQTSPSITTVAIASQNIAENFGAAVSQNEWTLTIASQAITENAGVTVTQGAATGTLRTELSGGASTSVVVSVAAGKYVCCICALSK